MNRQTTLLSLVIASLSPSMAYDMVSRWGQATLFLPSPPTLYIHGGKTGASGQTYTSSPTSADLIRLPLSSNFTTSSTPYELVTAPPPSSANALHTLSLLSGSQALIFGGAGGPSLAAPSGTDSAWLLNLASGPTLLQQTATWATQPSRRIYHSAASLAVGGKVFITGGRRADGSGTILADVYAFDPTSTSFSVLPALPRGSAHHMSVLLPNGTLVVFGGVQTSVETGNAALAPMSVLYSLDTSSSSSSWRTSTLSGTLAPARRGSAAVLLSTGTAVVLGGADVTLAGAMNDMWEMDFSSLSCTRIPDSSNGPSPRFDMTAVNVGSDQILVFGGYGVAGSADATTYIFDSNIKAWSTTFRVASASSTPPTASGSTYTSTSGTTTIPGPQASHSSRPSASGTSHSPGVSESPSDPTASPNPGADAQGSRGGLPTGAQIGLALGLVAAFSVIAILLLICLRRRRTQSEGGDRLLGGREGEKDGSRGIQADPSEWSEKGGIIGLGLTAYGVALVRQPTSQRYASLGDDEGLYSPPPARKPTRKLGQGIRLNGPRDNPSGAKSPPPRMNMLSDEDSRSFTPLPPKQDWTVDRRTRDSWRTATSILGHDREDSDPFDDNASLAPPPIRGGPVPSPVTSRSELNPFDDGEEADIGTSSRRDSGPGLYQLPPVSSDPLDLGGLLSAPSTRRYADDSLPRTDHSRNSAFFSTSHGSEADMEEGVVQHAHYAAHATPSILSPPPEGEYVPIKRNESFFRRMAAGGIGSLLTGSGRSRGSVRQSEIINIRDPAPEPTLWPVQSREASQTLDTASSTPTDTPAQHPPTSWAGQSGSGMRNHLKGPSLSSLTSARSMRDMVIVQREGTDSTEASILLSAHDFESEESAPVADPAIGHSESILAGLSPVRDTATSSIGTNRESSADAMSASVQQAARADGVKVSGTTMTTRASVPSIHTTLISPPSSPATPTRKESTPTKRSSIPQPPSGSPIPSGIVQHRRPVKDMVFSINKRSSQVLLDAVSPASQYSASPGASPLIDSALAENEPHPSASSIAGPAGRTRDSRVSWEVRKRGSLMVANPDKRGYSS